MKKYFIGIVAIFFAIALSIFTVSFTEVKNSNEEVLTWHKFNTAGTMELSPTVTYTGTASQAQAAFNCSLGISVICARAYDAEGIPTGNYIQKTPQ